MQYSTSQLPDTHDFPGVPRNTVTPSSRVKAVIVDALGLLLAWKPRLAMCLGRLVLRLCPNFRRV